MSAEGKKKRGASGLSKAKTSPFRLNGFAPDWQARKAGAYYGGGAASGGSITMRGLLGGMCAAALGYSFGGSFERAIAHAERRVTHPLLRV